MGTLGRLFHLMSMSISSHFVSHAFGVKQPPHPPRLARTEQAVGAGTLDRDATQSAGYQRPVACGNLSQGNKK